MFYNDPDSYYYLSLGLKYITPENVLFDKIVYNYGSDAGVIACFIAWLFCGLLLWSILWTIKKQYFKTFLFSLAFMFTPLIFYFNGFLFILDKNIFTLLIFMLLLQYMSVWKNGDVWFNTAYLFIIFWISTFVWAGWLILIVIFLLYNILPLFFYYKNKDKGSEITLNLENFDLKNRPGFLKIFFSGILIYIIFYGIKTTVKNAQFIREMHFMLIHLLLLECSIFIIFLILFYRFMDNEFISISVVCIASAFVFPRFIMFIAPLLYIMLYYLEKNYSLLTYGLIFIIMSQAIFFYPFYQNDIYKEIADMKDPCINETINFNNCTIISSWDNGHVLKYYFPEHKVKYKAHPTNINVMLDLLYYKNMTCKDCVYVYLKTDIEKSKYMVKNDKRRKVE